MEKATQRTAVTTRTDGYFEIMFQQPGALVVIVISNEQMAELQTQVLNETNKLLEAVNESNN
jgi:hypothetical protein